MEEVIKKQRKQVLRDLLLYTVAALWLWASAAYHTPKEYLWVAELFFAATMTTIYWSSVIQSKSKLDMIEYICDRDKELMQGIQIDEDKQFQFANSGCSHRDV